MVLMAGTTCAFFLVLHGALRLSQSQGSDICSVHEFAAPLGRLIAIWLLWVCEVLFICGQLGRGMFGEFRRERDSSSP